MTRSIYLPYKPIQAVRVNPFQRRFLEPFPAEASHVDSEKNQSERSNDSSIVLHQTAHVQDNTPAKFNHKLAKRDRSVFDPLFNHGLSFLDLLKIFFRNALI